MCGSVTAYYAYGNALIGRTARRREPASPFEMEVSSAMSRKRENALVVGIIAGTLTFLAFWLCLIVLRLAGGSEIFWLRALLLGVCINFGVTLARRLAALIARRERGEAEEEPTKDPVP